MIDVAALQTKMVWSGEATAQSLPDLPSHPLSICAFCHCHASIWDSKDKSISQDSNKGRGQILGGSAESKTEGVRER